MNNIFQGNRNPYPIVYALLGAVIGIALGGIMFPHYIEPYIGSTRTSLATKSPAAEGQVQFEKSKPDPVLYRNDGLVVTLRVDCSPYHSLNGLTSDVGLCLQMSKTAREIAQAMKIAGFSNYDGQPLRSKEIEYELTISNQSSYAPSVGRMHVRYLAHTYASGLRIHLENQLSDKEVSEIPKRLTVFHRQLLQMSGDMRGD